MIVSPIPSMVLLNTIIQNNIKTQYSHVKENSNEETVNKKIVRNQSYLNQSYMCCMLNPAASMYCDVKIFR